MQAWCETSSRCSPDPRSGAATITLDRPLTTLARPDPRCWVLTIAELSDLSTWHAVALGTPGAGTREAFAVGLDIGVGLPKPVDLVCTTRSGDSAQVSDVSRCTDCLVCYRWGVEAHTSDSIGLWGRARCDETSLQIPPY